MDPADGHVLWDHVIDAQGPGVSIPMAPIAAYGLVYIVNAGGDQANVTGHVYALDAKDGRMVWRFDVVPGTGPALSTWTNPKYPISGGAFWTSFADAEVLCAFARFCDPNGQVWNEVKDTDDPKLRVQFLQQVGNCPSGRLIAVDKHAGKSIEPKLPHSIGLVEDPAQKCSGPLWVRGGIPLVGADGQAYEIRNRMTLCRCGKSENKPFCNGAHAADPKFRDGLV
jgi:hypothetical protein